MRNSFDWAAIRAAHERGMTPTEIVRTLPNSPSRHAIEKKIAKEGWEVAKLPDETTARELVGDDATRAIVISYVRKGAPFVIAAKAAGITDRTLRNWREKDSAFSEMLEASRAAYLCQNIEYISDAASRDWRAAAYGLERAPETKDQYSQKSEGASLQIVLQIDRATGVTVDGESVEVRK